MMIRVILVVVLCAAMCCVDVAAQSTWTVPTAAHPTIQSAINTAQDGDTILVGAGTFVENIDFLGKEIVLIGAGPYATIIDGSANMLPTVMMHGGEGVGTILSSVGVTGGSGFLPANAPPGTFGGGGGLDIVDGTYLGVPFEPVDPPLIKNCRFFGNQCFGGAGVRVAGVLADAIFEDCVFEANVAVNQYGVQGIGGGFYFGGRFCRIERSVARDNIAKTGGGIASQGEHIELIDCLIEDNQAIFPFNPQGVSGGLEILSWTAILERTVIRGNVSDSAHGGTRIQMNLTSGSGLTMRSCLIVDNVSPLGSGAFIGNGANIIENCTISGNVDTAPNPNVWSVMLNQTNPNHPVVVKNSIIHGNTPNNFSFNGYAITVEHSNIQGGWPGTGNVDVPPGFVDPANGDYRLAHGSPMVDAGDPVVAAPILLDFEREPRVLYNGPDIGADECDDIAYHASSSGNLIEPGVGFWTTLAIGGDDGGADRRVEIPLGAPWSLSFDSPDWMQPAPQWAIFGVLGEPAHETVTTLPFGFGEMSLPPCPVLPAWEGILFTLASTVAGMPCGTLLPAAPGDLTFGPIPGCPIPLDVGFQALLIDGIGQAWVSNLVIARIR